MKKLILPLLLLLSSTGLAQSLGRYNNWCEEGGQIVVLQGLNSVTNVQQSAPLCTVEVFLSGTNIHASLFADNSGSPTPLSNPFTASTTGQFGFYATPGVFYDVVTSNGSPTLPNTVTYPYVIVSTPGTGTGTVTGFSSGNLSPLFTTSVATASSTPALTFTLSNANAHQWFGNNTGSTATPGYETIGTADLPFTYSGNTTKLMTVGTVSGTGSTLCTDAGGNATTVGCSGGGGGPISGSGTANTLAMWTGVSTVGNGPLTYSSNVLTFTDGNSNTIHFTPTSGSSGSNQFAGLVFSTGGQEALQISNTTLKAGFGQHGGDIYIFGSNGAASNDIGGGLKFCSGTGNQGAGNTNANCLFINGGSSILGQNDGDINIGLNPQDAQVLLGGGSGNGTFGGKLVLAPGTGSNRANSGIIQFGQSTVNSPVIAITSDTFNRTFFMQLPTGFSTQWTWTWPHTAGTANFLLKTDGTGVTDWVAPDPVTTANCAASGTGANPSIVACGAAKAGAVYCDVAASTGTCQINTTGVTANSEIIVIPTTTEGTRLGKTCNTAPSAPPAILVASKSAGNNFIINMSTVTTNGECYDYLIVN